MATYSHPRIQSLIQKGVVVVTLGILIVHTLPVLGMDSGQLVKIGGCTCPDDIVVYQCTVNAPGLGGFTIWRGNAFDCSAVQNRILLRHNSYQNGGAFGQCGNAIVGRSLRVDPNFVYVSQLEINITAKPELIGRTVECVYNPSGDTIIPINSTTIETEDSVPTPTGVQLANVTPDQLTFTWNPVLSDCPSLRYVIESNCGACDTTSSIDPAVSCSFNMPTTLDNVCMFAVRGMICKNISGSLSTPINVNLRVPSQPAIQSVTPTYGGEDGTELQSLNSTFSASDSFSISKGIDGSPLYYVVLYSIGGVECGSQRILPSACSGNVCTAFFDMVTGCRQRSGDISISVSAFNRLGSGPPSQLILGGNDRTLSNGQDAGVIAAAVIIPSLVLVIVAAIMIITVFIAVKRIRRPHSSTQAEQVELLGEQPSTNEVQSVMAHITFTIEDMPERLIDALRIFSEDVNIRNIKICPSEMDSEMPDSIKKSVYIECHRDFSDKSQTDHILKLSKEKLPDIDVQCVAICKQVPKDKEYDSQFMKVIREVIQDTPGSLCALLEVVQTDVCKHIVITDIILEPETEIGDNEKLSEKDDQHMNYRCAIVKFLPELPADWRKDYEKRKSQCKYIKHKIDKNTSDLSSIV